MIISADEAAQRECRWERLDGEAPGLGEISELRGLLKQLLLQLGPGQNRFTESTLSEEAKLSRFSALGVSDAGVAVHGVPFQTAEVGGGLRYRFMRVKQYLR